MALSRNYQLWLGFGAVIGIAIFFISLTLLPLESGETKGSSMNDEELSQMVLGSKPPSCMNKCMNCRPCEATLVVPPRNVNRANYVKSSHGEDDRYYLLSWKCKCGNKLYQP